MSAPDFGNESLERMMMEEFKERELESKTHRRMTVPTDVSLTEAQGTFIQAISNIPLNENGEPIQSAQTLCTAAGGR